jgi:NADPH-dependent curcumin reductase CurA
MSSQTNRQWTLASRPEGEPTMENFELVESPMPEPGPREVLVRTVYMSVDPGMRWRMNDEESYAEPWNVDEAMQTNLVGEVVESNHPEFAPGDYVQGSLVWAEYATANGDDLVAVDPDAAPISTALGVAGMPGLTAYFGMLDVGDPTPGDTVVVSGAAGAVGSVAGQLADLAGANVVGIAGTDEKCAWLTNELGFDAAINYKTEDVPEALAKACPDGVDVYFDNVGGDITDAVFELLNTHATVSVCGQISLYNATDVPVGPRKLSDAVRNRIRIEGFLVFDFETRYDEATERLAELVQSGDLAYRETITEGFENAPDALLGLFEGDNIGKQLVQVAEE